MDKEQYNQLKSKAFQAKNEQEWQAALQEIATAVKNDDAARQSLRNYILTIKDKKKDFFEKCAARPKFQAKTKMLVSEETDMAIREMCQTITAAVKKWKNV